MNRSTISRRTFLRLIGAAGAGATLASLHHGLGLTVAPRSPYRGRPALQANGAGRRVLVLGAGIAGLVAAYELQAAGYEVELIEARDRPGGRCWTVRDGATLAERDGPAQSASFATGLFFEAGSNRIPHHHRGVLDYCRELAVPLQLVSTINYAAYLYHERAGPLAGEPLRYAEVLHDLLGHSAELLALATRRGVFDGDLDQAQREALLDYADALGDLDDEHTYEGSGRARYGDEAPGGGLAEGEAADPRPLSTLLASELWRYLFFEWDYDNQMTQLHPVGGMDRLINAFAERLGPTIRYSAEVRAIQRTSTGLRVLAASAGGAEQAFEGEFCICTIPPPVLAQIPNDLAPSVQQALAAVRMQPATLVGLQFARRFWEDDDQIYGGTSWTDMDIGSIWYPDWGYHSAKGIVTGAYTLGEAAEQLGALSPDQRIATALTQGAQLHPQYPEAFEQGFSVAWHRDPYSLGAYALYPEQEREEIYQALLAPDDAIILAGEHMSYLNGWMEGAVLSAHEALRQIDERVRAGVEANLT
jgi:monoamine oxidase